MNKEMANRKNELFQTQYVPPVPEEEEEGEEEA